MQHLNVLMLLLSLSPTLYGAVLARPGPAATSVNNLLIGSINIEDNLVEDYDLRDRPPKLEKSMDYSYPVPVSVPDSDNDTGLIAVIDTVRKIVKVPSGVAGSAETKLRPVEEEEIKRLSAAFATAFGEALAPESVSTATDDAWKSLNPVLTLSKSGVTLAFGNATDETEEPATSVDDEAGRDALWTGLAKSLDIALGGNGTATPSSVDETSGWSSLVGSIWDVLSSSVSYVGSFLSKLFTSNSAPSEGSDHVQSTPASTTIGVFALEEPTGVHRLPSHEFEERGRDIDSLLYGHGIA